MKKFINAQEALMSMLCYCFYWNKQEKAKKHPDTVFIPLPHNQKKHLHIHKRN